MNNNLNNLQFIDDYNRLNNNIENKEGINNQLNDNEIISNTKLINIDSRSRKKESNNIINKTIKCDNDPISITKNSNMVTFTIQNHGLKEGNKITINNVYNKLIVLNEKNILFSNDNEYLQLNYTFLNTDYSSNINNLDQYIYINKIDCNNTNIGNINKNLLYGIHKIYYNNKSDNSIDNNNIYIKLPYKYKKNLTQNIILTINFNLLNLCGIPLNQINSDYPIDNFKLYGFKNIINVTQNTFSILTDTSALFTNNSIGGKHIIIGLIDTTLIGYPNNNNYKIEIPIIYNIKNISVLSADIPNTQYNITENNNKLYIDLLLTYTANIVITLNPGYYNINNLILAITNKINKLESLYNINKSINDAHKKITFDKLISNIQYNNHNDNIKFKIFIKLKMINSITYIVNNNTYLLKINHYNHNLLVGEKIELSNSKSIGVIPEDIINTTHVITEIINENNYLIKLKEFSTIVSNENSLDINTIFITYKLQFRLKFNTNNTFGDLLGFRNVGNENSITHYHTTISNTTPYLNEIKFDSNKKINIKHNNRINLNPINYIFLSCNLFYTSGNNLTSVKVNNSNYITIAKIYLNNLSNIVYNTHINLISKLDFIIPKLDHIELIFNNNNFNLYDFGNIDHSFILKFDIENILDKDAYINSNTGLSNANTTKQRVFITNT